MARTIKATALKKLKDTFRDTDILLPSVYRHVMRSISSDSERSTGHLHPSDMCKPDWCGRKDWYTITGAEPEKESQANKSFSMENVFAEGHNIHEKWQAWFAEMGILYGEWKCRACQHRWMALSPLICPLCSSDRVSYKEVPLQRNGIHIQGHADGALHGLVDHEDLLVELKSIGIGTLAFEAPRLNNLYQSGENFETIWFKINRPFVSHVRQGQFYLWMAYPRYEEILFIYEAKSNQRVKEFVVQYQPALIAPILDVAKEVSRCLDSGDTPPRPRWAEGISGKICRSCPFKRRCWGEKVEHGEEKNNSAIKRTTAAERRKALR